MPINKVKEAINLYGLKDFDTITKAEFAIIAYHLAERLNDFNLDTNKKVVFNEYLTLKDNGII